MINIVMFLIHLIFKILINIIDTHNYIIHGIAFPFKRQTLPR